MLLQGIQWQWLCTYVLPDLVGFPYWISNYTMAADPSLNRGSNPSLCSYTFCSRFPISAWLKALQREINQTVPQCCWNRPFGSGKDVTVVPIQK